MDLEKEIAAQLQIYLVNNRSEINKKIQGKAFIECMEIAKEMKNILFDEIKPVIPSFRKSDIVIKKPKFDGNDIQIILSFQNASLKRDSLNPNDELNDIVMLKTVGYNSVKHRISGKWHGKIIRNKASMKPNSFLADAVDKFNDLHLEEQIRAKLTDEYSS